MRACEISEAAANLRPVAQSAAGAWYKTSAAKVKAWFKQMHGGAPKLDADASVRYFVFVPANQKLWSLDNKLLQFSKGDLGSVGTTGGFYSRMEADALQALVDVIQARNGERIWGDFILYHGEVYLKYEFLDALPVVAQISTGAVHEVPPDARWTLGRVYLDHLPTATRVMVFKHTVDPITLPWSAASIRDGQLSKIHTKYKLNDFTQAKLSRELAQVLGLEQKVTVATHIMPNSKLHHMLTAISDNPGVERWKLYWDVLKLKKLPKYRSPQDLASELVSMKLVQEVEHPAHPYPGLHITPIGKLVLARVNAGHTVSKVTMLK